MISAFTPTHGSPYLLDAYRSLQRQRHQDWEWVVLPTRPDLQFPAALSRDPRVRILPAVNETAIGAAKRLACEACRGDVLLELDHDDMLMPGETLGKVAEAAKTAGFIFSDTAVARALRPFRYSDQYGWESYPVKLYGRTFQATRAFAVTPRSLSEVYLAPDHLRAWRRDAYFLAGGHDPRLSVGDDHELLCRTYLAGVKFQHTGGCHYLYRLHRQNTIFERSREIAAQSEANKSRYFGKLVREWCRRCGHRTVVWDGGDLPNRVAAGHLIARKLQHLDPQQLTPFMNWLYDSLLPGGYAEIEVPDAESAAADVDPLAKTRFNRATFLQYCYSAARLDPRHRGRFQLALQQPYWPSELYRQYNVRYLRVWLAKLADTRFPGLKMI